MHFGSVDDRVSETTKRGYPASSMTSEGDASASIMGLCTGVVTSLVSPENPTSSEANLASNS